MAKTFSDGILPVALIADADLSSYQYRAVKAGSDGTDYVSLANAGSDPTPIGILQNDPDTAGDEASVKCWGFTKAVVAACDLGGEACAIEYGDLLTCGSDGRLYRAGSGGAYCAKAFGSISTACYVETINVLFYGGLSATATGAS